MLRLLPIAALGHGTSVSLLAIALAVVMALLIAGALVWNRTRWGQARPVPRYALLSLVAHLLLAIVAATIRIVSLPQGWGEPEPIRVTVLTELPPAVLTQLEPTEPADETLTEVPPLPMEIEPVEPPTQEPEAEAPPVEAPPATEPTVEEPPTEKPLQAPALDVAKPPAAEVESPPVPDVVDDADVTLPDASDSVEPPPVAQATPSVPEPIPSAPTQPAPAAAALPPQGAPFADRLSPDRLAKAMQQGGSPETERAVDSALAWLVAAQDADGRWNAARWGAGRETRAVLGHDRGSTGTQADTGISALALLALLGAGNSHQQGPYQQTMADGLNFLIRSQRSDGNLAGDAELYAQTYCHSMATFALAESLAMTGDQRLRPSVERATNYLVTSQDAGGGGWRYRPGQPGDMSQLGWIVMALRSAELADVKVPAATWQRIEYFIAQSSAGQHSGRGCYMPGSLPSRAMTAEALYCRQILGLTGPERGESTTLEALAYLGEELPGDTTVNLYHWYYASLALHHAAQHTPAAQAYWQTWNNRLQTALLPRQEAAGAAKGSWPPSCVWAGYGGRVYSTAMATMCLEVYYRYHVSDPHQDPWIAARPEASWR